MEYVGGLYYRKQITYHIDISSTKPGLIADSRAPRKKRLVAMPAKDLHAGVVMRTQPHATTVAERRRPVGRCWSRKPNGN